jgi:transcriptional regulator with XRE-family HTH domain
MIAFELSTSVEICAALGQRLRSQRLAQNLSQAELAARTGLHRRTIENIETRTHSASLETIIKVAMRLSLIADLQDLFVPRIQSIAQLESAERSQRRRASRTRRSQ